MRKKKETKKEKSVHHGAIRPIRTLLNDGQTKLKDIEEAELRSIDDYPARVFLDDDSPQGGLD